MAYYAVKIGKTPGVYSSWGECADNVTGYPGAVYQKFSLEDEARAFLGEKVMKTKDNGNENFSQILLYTDGGCKGNPGIGGYGFVVCKKDLKDNQEEIIRGSGGFYHTTNNRMELLGVINGLRTIQGNQKVLVYSDSLYVCDAFNKKWIKKWVEKDFIGVKNPDLWKTLLPLVKKNRVEFVWVKGHSGNKYNEICDSLATAAMKSKFLQVDHGFVY